MNYSFDETTVVDEAVAAMVKLGFDSARALHVLKENAAQLCRLNTDIKEDEALLREAAATIIRFGA